jgi:hypothetical protein
MCQACRGETSPGTASPSPRESQHVVARCGVRVADDPACPDGGKFTASDDNPFLGPRDNLIASVFVD